MGGARNRSGPAPDPNSERSERRGYKLTALPSEGYTGTVPDFPLPASTDREIAVWDELWATPQACAWSMTSWRWGQIADLVRMQVRAEDIEVQIGVYTALRAARADLGLTPAGLKDNGWAIVADEVAAKRDEAPEAPVRSSSRSKLKVVPGVA